MSKENEKRNNAHRLVYALYSLAYDAATIKRLAMLLHYDAAQLQQDIRDLEPYVSDIEAQNDALSNALLLLGNVANLNDTE